MSAMTRLRRLRGFTLVELIVVVIILGVLVAIAAVSYNKFVGQSKDTAQRASAKQIAEAINAEAATQGVDASDITYDDDASPATPDVPLITTTNGAALLSALAVTGVADADVYVDSAKHIVIAKGAGDASVTSLTDAQALPHAAEVDASGPTAFVTSLNS